MKLSAALDIIRRHGRGVAICRGGRTEHHVQYDIDEHERIRWQAGGTVGGRAIGRHTPDLNQEGYQVFDDLYSPHELT